MTGEGSQHVYCMVQKLAGEDRKEAMRDEGREDMHWKVNVEVHDPDIGLVSLLSLPTRLISRKTCSFSNITGSIGLPSRSWYSVSTNKA